MTDAVKVTDSGTLVAVKVRLHQEREARRKAEQEIAEANQRYKQADANVLALLRLAELLSVFDAGGNYGPKDSHPG